MYIFVPNLQPLSLPKAWALSLRIYPPTFLRLFIQTGVLEIANQITGKYVCVIFFFFKLYIIVLVLPNIKMNPPQVYMCYLKILSDSPSAFGHLPVACSVS